ncbi:MAG TPA: HlyD family efflux transporter periplasmic adaptor subunit [Gammaproteobacteria bacterium]
MNKNRKQLWRLVAVVLVLLLGVAASLWQDLNGNSWDAGLVSGNGRIEAVEIDVAVKAPGRLREILVAEGEFVTAGQVLARMDTQSLQAQLLQAEAQLHQSENMVNTARSQLAQRQSENAAALAVVAQRQSELEAMRKRAKRITDLASRGVTSEQDADDARAAVDSAAAALSAAKAQVSATEAAITTARSQISSAESAVEAARAAVARVQSEIDDSTLVTPRDGRVQYIVARSGEVIGAGGRVMNLVDLGDVYMTFFLPTEAAGRLAIGTEARIVLDAAPDYVIPAQISYVADVAQFTPKTVETESERQKLMFRVRASISRELLERHIQQVKTGLPGVTYVRRDPSAPWPERLQQNLVQ